MVQRPGGELTVSGPMHSFRFVPTTAESGRLVHRPRLTVALAARFERRLTTMVAAAGFGKTAALALAIENNLLDPRGRDVWLSATQRDADADYFASGLARAFDVDNSGGPDEILDRVHDAIWAQAPDEVALVIDDAHCIDTTDARQLLLRLLDELPTNAHLVLASRTPVGVPGARLRAHGQLLELNVTDLQLTNDEVAVLVAHRRNALHDESVIAQFDGDMPRHAATADLALAAGRTAGADFLWEEILTHIDADRLADLQRASVVEILDDELVGVMTNGRLTLDELVADLPLTERIDDTVRLHALLRDALGARVPPTERRKAQEVAGEFERQRGRWADAVQLFEAAGDLVAAYETIREFCLAPVLLRSLEDSIVVGDAIQRIRPDSGVALAVLSNRQWMSQATRPSASTDFQRTINASIATLRAEGDDDVEAAQIHLRLQAGFSTALDVDESDLGRLGTLAASSATAQLLYAFNQSTMFAHDGDVDRAIEVLDVLEPHRSGGTGGTGGTVGLAQWRNERLADLGRFEDIEWAGEVSDVQSTAMMSAYARWLRGDVDPALGYLVVQDLLPKVLRRGFDLVSVSILGVAVAIAAAAGEDAAARRWCDQAVSYLGSGLVPSAEYFARLAQAIVAASEGDEDRAAEALDPTGTQVRFDGWPARPLFLSLPLIYLVRPDAREMFDRCSFGHALTVAVQAGRALVALRAHDDPGPAADLPWEQADLLRANLLPIHLVELAAAGKYAGNPVAGSVAMSTRHVSTLARSALDRTSGPTRFSLLEFTDGAVLTAPYELTTSVLGDPAISRDGTRIDDDRWARRTKVRELWTYLVVHRRTTRYDLISDLWPDSQSDIETERRALSNLRTTMSMLVAILEPDRPSDVDSFFISTAASTIALNDVVVSDLDLLQEAADSAQAADRAGLPIEALRHHRRVVELYSGALASPVDANWIVFERLRISTLATGSACRVAELHLGRGEPETAAHWAQQARHHDPLSERAGRLFIEALAASGDRPGARAAADHLARVISDTGMTLERATTRSFERLFGR